MTAQSEGNAGEVKRGQNVNDDYRLLAFIGLMLFFLGWLFAGLIFGWFFVPFGFYYLYRAFLARKGLDTYLCSVCGGTVGKTRLPKCPNCGIDLD